MESEFDSLDRPVAVLDRGEVGTGAMTEVVAADPEMPTGRVLAPSSAV